MTLLIAGLRKSTFSSLWFPINVLHPTDFHWFTSLIIKLLIGHQLNNSSLLNAESIYWQLSPCLPVSVFLSFELFPSSSITLSFLPSFTFPFRLSFCLPPSLSLPPMLAVMPLSLWRQCEFCWGRMVDKVNFLPSLLKADCRVKIHIFPNQDSIFQIKTQKNVWVAWSSD